ncbi:hypothetical protein [Spirosoma sp. KNUC1025]|uniref:hypothetical protein n=1 Tax=Spirosoma sp. KNUC1025 TaxID=2894082 RepID=UPI00386F9848|nr:hypothetical protein LN737_09290 [Spirosoma sp. KNUC1025]
MKWKILLLAVLLLISWILVDLFIPRKVDLRQFNPNEMARLDTDMWRSYYERKPLKLFWQSAELVRTHVRAPFWQSFVIAYHAARAAFIFKDGQTRTDYNRALPDLEKFYAGIDQLSEQPINVTQAAQNELEWWVIRRERDQHPPVEWANLQARITADLYRIPVKNCAQYGLLRTEAMLFRDQRGKAITNADWQRIRRLLNQSWQSLSEAVMTTPDKSS